MTTQTRWQDLPPEVPPARSRRLPPPTPRTYRPDIEGLRAIAIVTVVLYHAHLAFAGGYVGVDVFFVISGFLITRQLVKNVGTDGLRALPTFYGHRIRRLLPAAALVVVATVVAARLWAPVLQVRAIALDAIFTTFYGLNYRLAAEGTDYQHVGAAASPLEHFWSLGVEEQFYLLWPVLVVVATVIGRRWRRGLLLAAIGVIVVLSAHWSATITVSDAPAAYFSLQTRAWELGVGGLVALSAELLARAPRRIAGPAAWVGLAMIALSAVTLTDETAYPGTAAWVPVTGAALVIAAGCGPRVRAERLLGEAFVQCLGRISYSWYLWHWPMLVLTPYVLGHSRSPLGRCAVVWLSLVAALASHVLIEEPARRRRLPSLRWLAGGVTLSGSVAGVAALAIVLAPSTVGSGAETRLAAVGGGGTHGTDARIASAVARGIDTRAAPRNLTPNPADAAESLPPSTANGCHAGFTVTTEPDDCFWGDTRARRTVVLFGDSHMEQWLPAFNALGKRLHWRVVSWTKASCPPAALTVWSPQLNREYTECDQWRLNTIARIKALHPDRIIVSGSENVVPSGDVTPADYAAANNATLDALTKATAVKPHVILDIPVPNTDLPGCVASHLVDVSACTFAADRAYADPARHQAITAALRSAGYSYTDPEPWFCQDERCAAVVGNVLVYRNSTHMTVPYSTWLAPALEPLLDSSASTSGATASRAQRAEATARRRPQPAAKE